VIFREIILSLNWWGIKW